MNTSLVPSDAANEVGTGVRYFISDPPGSAGPIASAMIWQKLKRRKWAILASSLLLFGACTVVILLLPAWYTAEAEIIIDQRPQGVDLAAVLSRLPTDSQVVLTEAEALRSRSLAKQTIARLDLVQDPEFNPSIIPPNAPLRSLLKSWRMSLSSFIHTLPFIHSSGKNEADAAESNATEIFLKHLRVLPLGRSQVLKATFTSESPELAAATLNSLISLYVARQIEHRLAVPQQVSEYLRGQLAELQEKVRRSDQAVERYRDQAGLQEGIVQGRSTLLVTQEITEANAELLRARAKREEAEARLKQISTSSDSFADVLASPLIRQLREQESTLKQTKAELVSNYGPRYPKLLQTEASIADVERRIQVEIDKVVKSIESELAVQSGREAALEENLGKLKKTVGVAADARVELASLEQEAEANRGILTTLLTQYKQLNSQQALQVGDAYVISAADVPTESSFPPTLAFLAIALLGSLVTCGGAALFLERDGEAIRSSDDIQYTPSVRPLGLIPKLSRRFDIGTHVLTKPQSAFAESIRNLLCNLLVGGRDGRVVLITSARPGEGKTSVAVALARLSALSGIKTIVIDCDFRRPSIHRAFGTEMSPGFAQVLQGESALSDVRRTDELTSVHYVTSGQDTPHAVSLFVSGGVMSLVNTLRTQYELVIFDSPPSSSVSDAKILAQSADDLVFVVEWNRTSTKLVKAEIGRLQAFHAGVIGVLLNQVDVHKHSRYGYSDSGLYSGPDARYYVN